MAALITLSDVADLLVATSPTGSVGRRRADQITRHPTFPAPAMTTRAGRLWDRDEVVAWIATHRTPLDDDA